ncbi:rRNA maturation RNase YbeY [Leptospira sp. GIMC2001]|uniref:rRNA maturation RNase YbeY n=1 Tax=Leptospira sp. GIMC2001 TaxID=1513297 RepID=UPI00234A3649|nr:rRNA maturation RNase YbeY [Leptospira sp. GIMC2001]WCL48307.1 rRNA maturation RNase YbeY [Leptospira sp. GIMC2001]
MIQISIESTIHSTVLNSEEIDLKNIEKDIEIILSLLNPSWLIGYEFSLKIVTDNEMKSINRFRRGFDKTTDVLSFPMLDLDSQLPIQIIGEIIISWDKAKRQAQEIGHTIKDEFYRLLVHGILHLYGYDHETNSEDEIIMKSKEDELLLRVLGEGDWL